MKISLMTRNFFEAYGEDRGLEMMAKAGYDAVDYSFLGEYWEEIKILNDEQIIEHFTKIKEKLTSLGIYANQSHAPYAPWFEYDEKKTAERFEEIRKALLASSVLGVGQCVVHPCAMEENKYSHKSAENKAVNIDFYSRLLPYLDEYGVNIGIENMFTYDPRVQKLAPTVTSSSLEMADYVDSFNALCKGEKHFVAVLDIGHSNLAGEATTADMIRNLGSRLKGLHVHDNYSRDDNHFAPGIGNINWDEALEALKEIGYDGDFTYEAHGFFECFDKEMTYDAGVFLCKLGKHLCEKHSL